MIPDKVFPEDWDLPALQKALTEYIPAAANLDITPWSELTRHGLGEEVMQFAEDAFAVRAAELGSETLQQLARFIILRVVDSKWMAHLDAMDELREGIGLRAYAQKDPLVEYKLESFEMFQQMSEEIKHDVVRFIFHVQVTEAPKMRPVARPTQTTAPQPAGQPAKSQSVGRNDPCPCGSGKKYKKCCGRDAD